MRRKITTFVSIISVAFLINGCEMVDEGLADTQSTNKTTHTSKPTDIQSPDRGDNLSNKSLKKYSIKVKVSSSTDDAEESSEGKVNIKSSDLEMVQDDDIQQIVGIRFDKVSIPKGANVIKAVIRFTADEKSSDIAELVIQMQKSSNPPSFESEYFNISDRKLFDKSVDWTSTAWDFAGQTGENQTTPNLNELVQDVIGQRDWESGNSMVFIISGEGRRVAQSFDGDNIGAPELYIEYEADPDTVDESVKSEDGRVNSKKNTQDEDSQNGDDSSKDDYTKGQKHTKDQNGRTLKKKREDHLANNKKDDQTSDENSDNNYTPEPPTTKGDDNINKRRDDKISQRDDNNLDNKINNNRERDNNTKNQREDDNTQNTTPKEDKNNKKRVTDDGETPSPIVLYPRLSWDNDPSHSAVIGFTPKSSKDSYRVIYGYSTDESMWDSKDVSITRFFNRSLVNKFVRLDGLKAGSDVYFRVCNDTSCGERYRFKTAPEGDKPFVFVAGGDTRSGWSTRRAGNRLISKIRPLFVMHGGDFTNGNSAREMKSLLSDWTLAYSKDTIDGVEYTRIYPIIPAHGNHEDGNFNTLCEVFGIDPNQDGECTKEDTYGSFSVGSLLRVYTLNSQFKYSNWSSEASKMNSWLRDDLQNSGSKTQWRVVQYHKPMFPHYSKKHTNPTLFNWWAELFYNESVNLVVESDTHIAKVTDTVKPNGRGFVSTRDGGTLYVGEGSWGAPARSANRPYDWTLDLASIQQFKVVTVKKDSLDVRTAQFNGSVDGLSKSDRDSNPTKLPTGINWWKIKGKGTNLKITPTANRRSHLE